MSGDNPVGSKISLTSNSEIRYEGYLDFVNSVANTVGLRNVSVFGTEGRTGDPKSEIPPGDELYEYIVFRGGDIKDLTVHDPPPPKQDPAIVTAQPMASSEGHRAQTAPQAPAQHPPLQPAANRTGGAMGNWPSSGGPQATSGLHRGGNRGPPFHHPHHHAPHAAWNPQYHTQHGARYGGGGRAADPNEGIMRPNFGSNRQHPQPQRRDHHAAQQQHRDGGGRRGYQGTGSRRGFQANEMHTGTDFVVAPPGQPVEEFKEDFDFARAQEDFNARQDEEESAASRAAAAESSSDKCYDHAKSFYDKISCETSANKAGRQRPNPREEREQQTKLDTETFGREAVGAIRSGFRHRGRGRGGGGRGGGMRRGGDGFFGR